MGIDRNINKWKRSPHNILLQTTQSILRSLEDIVILTDSEAEVILRNMGIPISIELSRGNGSDANLMDKEPTEFEVARTRRDMRREGIVLWEFDRGHVGENEIAALGVGVLSIVSISA